METISYSSARKSFKSVLDRVCNDADYTIITRRDAPDAVLLSLEQFNSLMETVYLVSSPENKEHLSRSIDQFQSGQLIEHAL